MTEENHYYAFCLKHSVYNTGKMDFKQAATGGGTEPGDGIPPVLDYVTKTKYDYKYNGKEWQDELGLNMYDMDMRQYDPAIARWVVLDPVIHHSMSPYNSFDNNPVFWADPSGMDSKSTTKELIEGIWNATPENGSFFWQNTTNDDQSSDEEPPINLFGTYEKGNPFNAVVNYAKMIAEEGDGIYQFFGHGTSRKIVNETGVGPVDINTVEKLKEFLKIASPQLLKDLEDGKEITVILYTCNSGSTSYLDDDGETIINNNPFAKQISKAFPNASIVAPNGYVRYGPNKDGHGRILGIRRNDDTVGMMLTYKNDQEISSRAFDYNEPIKQNNTKP